MIITTQKVTSEDVEQLQKISRKTFYETFAGSNTEADMQKYLDESFSKIKLTTELINPNSEFYFAILDNEIIGYLQINFGASQSEVKEEKAPEVERIYVLQKFHGQKIGQILCEEAIEIAQQKKSGYVWLGGREENPRAISFYRKNGFVE